MLIQIPVFIMLYSALMSPQFIQMAGNTNFLFINRLDATIKSNAGVSLDGKFSVGKNAQFQAGKSAKVFLANNQVIENVKIEKPQKAVFEKFIPHLPAPQKIRNGKDNSHYH